VSGAEPGPEPGPLPVAVRDLLAGLVQEPWGQTSSSMYETGRLVVLAPWLTKHHDRIQALLAGQRPDGLWGPPDGYALVPSLSATEALLGVLAADSPVAAGPGPIDDAAGHGLQAVARLLHRSAAGSIPDTPAVDLLVPALVGRINDRLARSGRPERLPLPSGLDERRLTAVRHLLASGAPVPPKLLHAAEVVADVVRGAPGIQPVSPGGVGASPAATAAWLGGPPTTAAGRSALSYLEAVVTAHDGSVPCAAPITVFERSWVLSTLARVGLATAPPPELVAELTAVLDPAGIAAGPGLPPDADTTSVTLYTLTLLGAAPDLDSLWAFEVGPHFCTWPGEDGVSVTTNAHVLDALSARPDPTGRRAGAIERIAGWLCDQQNPDGAWSDRWHASPYYATACCALALATVARQREPSPDGAIERALGRARAWVLATQRADGSWGRWSGTAEETAYAVHVLLSTRPAPDGPTVRAATRAYAYLLGAPDESATALWHDKDLYRPTAIVRATILAAVHLCRQGSYRNG
jgi:halimadienyl-diphosphate synthase